MPPKGPSLLTFPNPFFCPKQGGHSLPDQSPPPLTPLRVRSKLPRTCGPRPSADDLAEGIIPPVIPPRNTRTRSRHTRAHAQAGHKATHTAPPACASHCVLPPGRRPVLQPPVEGLVATPQGPSPFKPTVQCAGTPGGLQALPKADEHGSRRPRGAARIKSEIACVKPASGVPFQAL